MREERFVVAGICVGAMLLGVASETMVFTYPPVSDCSKLTGLSVCQHPAREAFMLPHVETTTTSSNTIGTPLVIL